MNDRPRLDAETKVAEVDHKAELRLWLRLLTCTTLIEAEVRRRLRREFDETLPRFDLMAQLWRLDHGMTLGEVSKRMMVSAGNVTSLVDRLVKAGYVERRPAPHDRRSQLIRLSRRGREHFGRMAAAHEAMGGGAARRPPRQGHRRHHGAARQGQGLGERGDRAGGAGMMGPLRFACDQRAPRSRRTGKQLAPPRNR